jgi:BolA-like protein 3
MSSEDRISGMKSALEEFGAEFSTVEDTSGGCGAFYKIHVVADKFQGMPPVKRQREVHALLHEFIHDVHGVTVR